MNKIVFSIDIEREGDFVYDGERIIKEAGDMAESEWVSVFAERIWVDPGEFRLSAMRDEAVVSGYRKSI